MPTESALPPLPDPPDIPIQTDADGELPSYGDLMARLARAEEMLAAQQRTARLSQPADDEDDLPSLIVPTNRTPVIDLTRPEDCPDRPDGEWSKRHLLQFLARQPRSVVFIPKENWEAKGVDTFQTVGYQGHWFQIRKGRPESVPIQIATIIEQSQEEFPTAQSKLRKLAITDIRDLPNLPGSRGMAGVEVALNR